MRATPCAAKMSIGDLRVKNIVNFCEEDAVIASSMLVDVVSLRRDGQKLSKSEILGAKRLRAELRVQRMPGGLVAQLLFPWHGAPGPGTRVPTLQDCRLQRVTGEDIVLLGTESVGMHHERRREPQAWWCRIVAPSGEPAGA